MSQSHEDATISDMYQRTKNVHSDAQLDARILDYAHQAVSQQQQGKPWLQKLSQAGFPLAMAASVVVGMLLFRSFVAPYEEVATPRYLSQGDTWLNTPVTREQPGHADETDTRVAQTPPPAEIKQKARIETSSESTTTQQATAKTPPMVAKPSVQKTPQKRTFAKKSVSDNPLMAPVNTRIGEPDPEKMNHWYEEITKLFKEGKETDGKKALAKFLKKYPQHKDALALQKSLKNPDNK